ncbi:MULTISPECIES: sugar phosphate isomerase/epimerase [unclassified Clostridium]|uniref:sugar phosphate isomerase/epimerase family protein n=1 Tax=unclassified Clostridium TaxID=2614128 RepID=UPI000297EC4C|nr:MULTISPECIES: sugar phosphate isomerase/epimerase [unclassified Clostridium]EKQ50470.1 MAG: xylose isomerase-like enzyme [Clostridium sp. Maddingley MBC34-26]
MNQLGINLLVFKNDLDNGREQEKILSEIGNLGISIAEIRREYLKNTSEELKEISKLAKELDIEIYYSVPEKIACEKRINSNIKTYFEEAKQMGSTHIKFNIGDLENLDVDERKKIEDIIGYFNIKVTIENDQTVENGNLKCVKNAIDFINSNSLPIGYTFDLGNWYWQNEDPKNAFDLLNFNINVFHLKNVSFLNNTPSTTLISEGKIDWKLMLNKLSKDIPVIIEYPIKREDILGEIAQVKEVLIH